MNRNQQPQQWRWGETHRGDHPNDPRPTTLALPGLKRSLLRKRKHRKRTKLITKMTSSTKNIRLIIWMIWNSFTDIPLTCLSFAGANKRLLHTNFRGTWEPIVQSPIETNSCCGKSNTSKRHWKWIDRESNDTSGEHWTIEAIETGILKVPQR